MLPPRLCHLDRGRKWVTRSERNPHEIKPSRGRRTFHQTHRGPSRQQRGAVLIVITVVILLASLTGYGLLAMVQAEHKAARASAYQAQNAAIVHSGCEYLASLLERPQIELTALGGLRHNPELFQDVAFGTSGEIGDDRVGGFTLLGPPQISPGQEEIPRIGVENESAKLHLGQLLLWDEQQSGSAHLALMQLPGMTDQIADAILDWIDDDDTPRPVGAESDYYRGLESPRVPRNGLPDQLEELLLVRDVTREMLFGQDRDQNYLPDQELLDTYQKSTSHQETSKVVRHSPAAGPFPPWSRYLTIYSAERNEMPNGQPRIHVNQLDLGQLHETLLQVFPVEWADFIVAYRQLGPASDSTSARGQQYQVDLAIPPQHDLKSPLELIDATVSTTDKAGKRLDLESPFSTDSTSLANDLPHLLDAISVDDTDTISGRVNIAEAPREVLAAVPGIDEGLVEQILADRSLQSMEDNRHDVTWLLTDGRVDLERMTKLLPNITVGGDVVRVQIVAFVDEAPPAHRVETVIDASVRPACRRYYRDLRMLGRGFPEQFVRGDSRKDGLTSNFPTTGW